MNFNDFLELNGQTLNDKEWKDLMENAEEEYIQIYYMEDAINDLKDLMQENQENAAEDIIDIDQESPGFEFWAYTDKYVYFSDEDDCGDRPMVIRNTIRYPGITSGWKVVTYDNFVEMEHTDSMKELISDLEYYLEDNLETREEVLEIEFNSNKDQFRAFTHHRVYYTEMDDWGDELKVRQTFRRPSWMVTTHDLYYYIQETPGGPWKQIGMAS